MRSSGGTERSMNDYGPVKRIVFLTIVLILLLCGCERQVIPSEPAAEPAAMPEQTETAQVEPEPTDAAPVISYDPARQTLTVTGTEDYLSLALPAEVQKARLLLVQDDDFELSVYLPVLRDLNRDVQAEMPGMIDRTDRSICFLRQYLSEHAGAAFPAALAEKPLMLRIDRSAFGYLTDDERITIEYNDSGTHREFLYLLSLMNTVRVGWEQIGYAWYVGTCIDPYSEVLADGIVLPDMPYYQACVDAGVDPEQAEASDVQIVYDVMSRRCFDLGLTHWGSYCASAPVSSEAVFTRAGQTELGDGELSAFMAASFLGWLNERYGFEAISLFCFGQKTFDEAFGTDYASAFRAWKTWILESYAAW